MNLFPRDAPRTQKSHGERHVYDALKKCSRLGWSAWHSLRLRTPSGFEGEGDFVIADPERGLLVLEVKGGAIELRNGRWSQNGEPMDKPPRDQAQGFVRSLARELERLGAEVPPWGVACAFPDCDFSEPPRTGDLRGLVLGRRELPHLETVLPDVLTAALPPRSAPRSRKWLQVLAELWGETWVPSVSLQDRVEDARERTIALDAQQLQLMDMVQATSRALVEGAAGTGKTIVAAELCRRRARAGARTLYLCFTDALAEAVDRQFASEPEAVRPRAASIRQYALRLLEASGPVPRKQNDSEFWNSVSLQAACDALPPEGERPEMVVVDEAQDFDSPDWMLVEQLAGRRGLWVFKDPRQTFWSRRDVPESVLATLGARLALLQKYRCPPPLAEFADLFAGGGAEGGAGARPGDALRLVEAPADRLVDRVRHELDELRRKGARPQDIAILSLAGQTRSELFHLEKVGTHRVVHADSDDAPAQVVVDTFLRFKGLERPFVLVTELSGSHVTHFDTRMHIALTRATVGAVVVATPDVVDRDARLRGLRSPG